MLPASMFTALFENFASAAGPAGLPGLLAATVAMVAAGLIRGFTGFGAALIVVPILSVIYSPQIAVPISFLSGLPSFVQLLPTAVRQGERAFILPVAGAAFIAAPLGAWVLASASPDMLKIVIAVAVLAMAALMQSGWKPRWRLGVASHAGVGGLCGLIQGVAGIGGPPAVAAALARGGAPEIQRANVIGATLALAFSLALPLWRLGFLTEDVLWLALLFVPSQTVAVWLGSRYFARGGQRHYRRAALLTLFAVGLFTLTVAIRDYGGGA